jgi:hypothetical protein
MHERTAFTNVEPFTGGTGRFAAIKAKRSKPAFVAAMLAEPLFWMVCK